MLKSSIPFAATGHFSKLILDYLSADDFFNDYTSFPLNLEAMKDVISRRKSFPVNRKLLSEELLAQYSATTFTSSLPGNDPSISNIHALTSENTYTITTGHQLNLFTGPLYFVYKILSVIKLTEALNVRHPSCHFVPVYWMATEDHDFEEIKSVTLSDKTFTWQTEQKGAVGRFSTEGLSALTEEVCRTLFQSEDTSQLKEYLLTAYTKNNSLAAATRCLVHSLFGKYGLVVVDADSPKLKKAVIPLFTSELTRQSSFHTHQKTTTGLEKNYGLQVHPREINLFYLRDNVRERIVQENTFFKVLNTQIHFSEDEILKELKQHPERFSPNVILRPLSQETILPNLAYIGGPAEVHYWLQLKAIFDEANLFYPMVLLRNCLLLMDKPSLKRWEKTGLDVGKIFLPLHELQSEYIKTHFSKAWEMEELINEGHHLFQKIKMKALQADVTLEKHAEAEELRFLKRLKATENKIIRSLKRKEAVQLKRITELKEQFFPNGGLQERSENMLPYLSLHGFDWLDHLKDVMEPLAKEFLILEN